MVRDRSHAYYVTTLDRIGWAILAGGLSAGFATMLLVVAGGERSPVALGLAWIVGTIVAALGIVTVAGPAWLILHRRGHRGPGTAAATAGVLALALFTAAQLWGTGGAGGYRLASALGTSLLVALAAGAIGAVMQRAAYRRLL